MADGIKAFFKEDLIPGRSDKALFVLAPMISIITSISIFAVIPFGNQFTFPGRTGWSNCGWPMLISGFSISSVLLPWENSGLSWEEDVPGISMV